jgi:hypothetical protein
MRPIRFKSKTTPWYVPIPARFSADGKRKSKYFRSKIEADAFCHNFKKFGPSAVLELPTEISKVEEERLKVAIIHAAETVGGDISKVYEAIEHYRKTRLNIKPATVRDALEAFEAWRKAEVAASRAKKLTYDSDMPRLRKLLEEFGPVQMVEITTTALREFFDTVKGDLPSVLKSVRFFFGWAVKRNFLVENPMAPLTAKELKAEYGVNNDHYKVGTFHRMLRIAAGLDPVKPGGEPTRALIDLLPWFVVSGFLGLRSCEARRENRAADSVRWSDLHFEADTPFVEIRRIKSNSRLHHVERPYAIEAAKAWLALVDRPAGDGPVALWTKRQIQELKRDFKKATGMTFIENGFRNSFATYALAFDGLQGVGKLALEMGTSEAIAMRHYVKTIAPGSGRAWFNLRPESNVIPMPGVAVAA